MAQNWIPKQSNWLQRFSAATTSLLQVTDQLGELCNEFALNEYGEGGANALTDSAVQSGGNFSLPAATALEVWEAEGVIAGANMILSMIGTSGTQRGYLENVRP